MLPRTAFMFIVGFVLCGAQIVFPGEEGSKNTGGRSPVPRPVGPSADQPAEPPITPGEDPSADKVQDPANPQTRIFGLFGDGLFGGGGGGGFGGGGFGGGGFGSGGGLFGGLGSIFNPCSRCNFNDIKFAHTCCQRGERQCCQYTGDFGFNGAGFGSGFGHGAGFGNGFGHGAVGPDFGGHGFDGIKPGFKPVGPPGFIPSTGGFSNIKPGFCPKPHIFEGLLGTRSVQDEEKESGGNKVSFRSADEPNVPADSKVRRRRQATERAVAEDPQGSTLNADPQTRFFPGLSKLPNPFCRDECFTDFDCPGPLKCCINFKNCRDCARPRFF